ncbi:MAG TPA: hypothetical protein VFB13_00020 [Reyranella sp.]|nr:hypothetical protein [Reyranella sp.]
MFRLLPTSLLVGLLAGALSIAARAENWLSSGDACMDLDSVHVVTGAKVGGGALVAYQASACQNDHPDQRRFLIAVSRDDCPAILNGATSFAYFMHEPQWPDWRQVSLSGANFRSLAFTACGKKGEPDGVVEFDNEMSHGRATVLVDGRQVCQLNSMGDSFVGNTCNIDLRQFGANAEYRHTVRIVTGLGDVNDTVSISDCHWNWQGTKVFEIMDEKVHFDCM